VRSSSVCCERTAQTVAGSHASLDRMMVFPTRTSAWQCKRGTGTLVPTGGRWERFLARSRPKIGPRQIQFQAGNQPAPAPIAQRSKWPRRVKTRIRLVRAYCQLSSATDIFEHRPRSRPQPRSIPRLARRDRNAARSKPTYAIRPRGPHRFCFCTADSA
jgi:hypothetical protein